MKTQNIPPNCLPGASKQVAITKILTIPQKKPPLEHVINSSISLEITKIAVINTPLHVQGQPLSKVVITGKAQIVLKYVADVMDQQVHGAVFHVPFDALIKWPGGPLEGSDICVGITVEHYQTDPLDKRDLINILVIRLDLYPKDM